MEALPKQHEGVVVVIDIDDDDDGEEEEEQANQNQTDNEEQEDSRCSSSTSSSSSSSSTDEAAKSEIIKERRSSVSSLEVDLESEVTETKLHLANVERDCRICHLSLDPTNQECDLPIELGCSCKDDLAAAHKHCAEAWFKIKGNRICEICGSTALNVAGPNETEMTEQWNEPNDSTAAAAAVPVGIRGAESRNFWQGHRFLNFLLACMVFAFVISWLFHFNIPS